MKHYYENVPRLGNVAVSRHAQSQMLDAGISQEAFDRALLDPTQPDAPDGQDILWRERDGLRLVILTNPTPNRGARGALSFTEPALFRTGSWPVPRGALLRNGSV
jgi:hypothetical protein